MVFERKGKNEKKEKRGGEGGKKMFFSFVFYLWATL